MRKDIQCLRGIAVLFVVLYHADLFSIQAGYLGVDIFFVISGYLIVGLVMRDVRAHRFSIRNFYWRRAKRLLPASATVTLGTAIVASFLLTPRELESFVTQLAGTVTFTANMVLLSQSGYFAPAAEMMPLLHMWSLSVEEQFYLVVPATLLLVRPHLWGRLLVAGVVGSLLLCITLTTFPLGLPRQLSSAFYLLPTRAWQLGLGALVAYVAAQVTPRVSNALGLVAVVVLLTVAVHPFDRVHPRADAAAVCLSTAALIMARPRFLNSGLLAAALARVGDVSYSLYLVHWPLFAFASVLFVGQELPAALSVSIVVASFLLAGLLYKVVEQPIHTADIAPRPILIGALVAASLSAFVPPLVATLLRNSDAPVAHERLANFGLDSRCDFSSDFMSTPECRTSAEPRIVIWGDSHAMALTAGLADSPMGRRGLEQATRSMCGPFLEIAPVLSGQYGPSWAASCVQFNDSVVSYISSQPSITHVVLAGMFEQYLRPGERLYVNGQVVRQDDQIALRSLVSTIATLRKLGKRVVVVAPIPSMGADIGLCNERRMYGKAVVGLPADCSISRDDYTNRNRNVIAFLRDVGRESRVPILWPSEYLCDQEMCQTRLREHSIYRDAGHFSRIGSTLFVHQFGIDAWILENGR